MPDKKVIAATIQIETGNSIPAIAQVNKELGQVKQGLKETGATATSTGKQIEGSTGSFSKLKEQMTALPGPLGAAGEGVGKLNQSFKALLANPVGLVILAIVAALALLYKAFENSFSGGQKMEQVFAGIKAAAQSLFDNLGHIGSAIVKFFKFDFSGAVAEIKGVAKAAGEAYTAMSNLTEQAQKLHQEQLKNDLEQAERQKKLAILREQATDDSISPAKRKAALKELQAEAEENAKQDIDLAKRTTENLIAQKTLEKDGALKNQDEINEAKIKQIQVETDNANELRRIGKQVTAADKQEIAERKAAASAAAEQRKKDLEPAKALELKLIEDNYLLHLDANEKLFELERRKHAENLKILKKGNQDTLAEIIRNNAVVNAITAKALSESADYTQKVNDVITAGALAQIKPRQELVVNQTQLEKDNTTARMAIADLETQHKKQQIEEVKGLLSELADIVGKQTVAGKALGIATALINTYQGASEAIKQKSTLPSPFDFIAKAINVAAIIAMGLKTVKAIVAVQVPGGGGGGGASVGSAPSITAPAAPIAPTVGSTNISNADAINNAGQAKNIRAYMVESDNAASVNRAARLAGAAVLGGHP